MYSVYTHSAYLKNHNIRNEISKFVHFHIFFEVFLKYFILCKSVGKHLWLVKLNYKNKKVIAT